MTEERKSEFTLVADMMPEANPESGISSYSAPQGSLQMSADGGTTWIDVDASWDGKGSLDDHRQKVLQSVKQPGFGDAGKVKSDA